MLGKKSFDIGGQAIFFICASGETYTPLARSTKPTFQISRPCGLKSHHLLGPRFYFLLHPPRPRNSSKRIILIFSNSIRISITPRRNRPSLPLLNILVLLPSPHPDNNGNPASPNPLQTPSSLPASSRPLSLSPSPPPPRPARVYVRFQ